MQIVSDVDIASLIKDLVLVAGWMDVHSDPSVWIIDMQVCVEHTAILFKVSNDRPSGTFGLGTYIRTYDMHMRTYLPYQR